MKNLMLFSTIFLLMAHSVFAQRTERPQDPIQEHFFSPELIMSNQKAIGLTREQGEQIHQEMKNAQVDFIDLNWKLQQLAEEFQYLISRPKVAEKEALEQLSKLLLIENQVKSRQITLFIRIKNILSEEQQAKINRIKKLR